MLLETANRHFLVPTPEGATTVSARMIDSSNISWIGWPRFGKQPLMFVEFKDGSRYVYAGVSRQKALACAKAKSSGSYLAKRIKPHHEALKLR